MSMKLGPKGGRINCLIKHEIPNVRIKIYDLIRTLHIQTCPFRNSSNG